MASDSRNRLFCEGDLDGLLWTQTRSIPEIVSSIPTDQFLGSTDQRLVHHLVSRLRIVPLTLYEDNAEMEQNETLVDVSGDRTRYWSTDFDGPRMVPATEVIITIPYTGDPQLWKLKPNPCRHSFPVGSITPPRGEQAGTLIITIIKPHDADEEQFRKELDKTLSDVHDHIKTQRGQVERHNDELPEHIRAAIDARRQRLQQHEGLSAVLAIPLKRREGAPPIKPIKVEEKITKPLPPPSKSGCKPEPGITDELYDNILAIIRHEGRTFETAPATFAKFKENELREVILAHLNGHYQGGATGETFRKSGKTDIRIEDQERAAFIGECKVWRGTKQLLQAVDQLLGYLTWRDCKASLIIFNKDTKGFTRLLKTVREALSMHPLLVNYCGEQRRGEWRYVFRSAEDEERHILVHVFLFNICHNERS